ncbi:MAG: RluA family pseudouridine synthase [Elusimicrobia bacterium]|nr:RluA family pseudouridine synthase [Elusimicrobiota bacterium]
MNKKLIYQRKERERIDLYIKDCFKLSRESVKQLLKDGSILVKDKRVEPSYLLKAGDDILIKESSFYKSAENKIYPENFQLDIIYSDSDIIVINKTAGILTHPTEKIRSGTVVNFLLKNYSLYNENKSLRPGVVHRLDKETSGVMVFTRTESAWNDLFVQFKNRIVKKEYLAIVKGRFVPLKKRMEFTVSPDKSNYTKMKVHYLKGKKTITIIEVVKYMEDLTLVKVKPITGRTHQIRLALSHSGYPIIGDTKYGVASDLISRVALHSYRISLYHPTKKERCEFKAPVPDDFLKITGEIDNSI